MIVLVVPTSEYTLGKSLPWSGHLLYFPPLVYTIGPFPDLQVGTVCIVTSEMPCAHVLVYLNISG
jgi:hypothetical protein